jgi:metal-responsive CopG/Arc/MetJ family transcriptional regulator
MKVAVSIPDPVFAEAEALARKLYVSRSKLYALALGEYVSAHAPDRVTEAMNAAVAAAGCGKDKFVGEAARRTLARSDW